MANDVKKVPRKNKAPDEIYTVGWRYTTDTFPSGATFSSGVLSATMVSDGSDVTGTLLVSAVATISGDGMTATGQVQAGTDGEDYVIKFTNTLTNGEVFVDYIIIKVREYKGEV